MTKHEYRVIYAELTAARESADRALDGIRAIKAQLEAAEDDARRRSNRAHEAVAKFEAQHAEAMF